MKVLSAFWRVLVLFGVVGLALLPHRLLERDSISTSAAATAWPPVSDPTTPGMPASAVGRRPLPLTPVAIPPQFREPLQLPPTPAGTHQMSQKVAVFSADHTPPTRSTATITSTPAPPGETVVPESYEAMFREIGYLYGLDWRLLASTAYHESRFNPKAVGLKGEMGLMQIMPSTWEEFAPQVGVTDPYDPYSSGLVGAHYLVYLHDRFRAAGRPEIYWALAAYNWGPGNINEVLQQGANWGELPQSSQRYVWRILKEAAAPSAGWWERELRMPVYSASP